MAATIADDEVMIRDVDNVDTSFPGFCDRMTAIGGEIEIRYD
jgi:5-enolpyruvylshikimate-3-phosphate synthase